MTSKYPAHDALKIGGHLTDMEVELNAEFQSLLAQNAKFKKRLEIDIAHDGNGKEVPFEDGWPDGIECRDANIKILSENCVNLRDQNAKYKQLMGEMLGPALDGNCEAKITDEVEEILKGNE